MSMIVNLISQPSLDTSPIWIPVISKEVGKLQHNSVECVMKLLQLGVSYGQFFWLCSMSFISFVGSAVFMKFLFLDSISVSSELGPGQPSL
jgi:hypothetical protein